MPFFHNKKGGKTQRGKQDCSYENVDFHELPKLHSLVLGEASTAKLKGFISKKVSNINEADKHGRTALHYAASIGNEKALNILLQCGLTVDLEKKDDEGKTALFKAVEVFSEKCVHVLLEHKAATDVWDNHKSTPLHIATVNRKTVIVSLISKANGNLSIKDKMGFSPLHVAAAFGYLETAKELIDCGADINAKDGLGRTPLMAAACEGTPKMVHLLLGYGADPSIKDNFNHTAIDHSKQNQSESMTKIIKEAVAQRGFIRVDSTEAEAIARTDVQNSPRRKDDKELDFNVDQPTTEPEIVIKIDTIDDRDDLALDQEFLQDVEKSSDLNEIVEDVQEATDVNIAQASALNLDEEDKTNEPDQSHHTELLKHSLLYENDVTSQNSVQDGPSEPSFQLQQDSLYLLQKRRASQGHPKSNVQKRVSFSSDSGKQHRLTLMKNRRLKEENSRLKSNLTELLKETNLETEKQQKELEIKKSQLQFINMKNKIILEEKIKQCSKLEIKLKEAHYHLISEIEKAREGANLEDITKDMVQDLNQRLKSSDMRIDRLMNQLKSTREANYLLETEVGSLKGRITVFQEIINKKNNEKSFFENLTADRIKGNDDDESLMFYKEEYERNLMENKTLQDSLNKMRMENAMLKEQHLSDKHETQMIKNELAENQEQVLTLQYQLENMKNRNKETISYRDLLDGSHRSSIDRNRLRREDLQRVRNINIERAKSDSTLHGFRTFDSSVFVGSDYDSNQRNQTMYHAADLTGMQ